MGNSQDSERIEILENKLKQIEDEQYQQEIQKQRQNEYYAKDINLYLDNECNKSIHTEFIDITDNIHRSYCLEHGFIAMSIFNKVLSEYIEIKKQFGTLCLCFTFDGLFSFRYFVIGDNKQLIQNPLLSREMLDDIKEKLKTVSIVDIRNKVITEN